MNIAGALGAGYSIKAILGMIMKAFPQFGERIGFALASGKKPEEILKYLQKLNPKILEDVKSGKIQPESVTTDNPYLKGDIAAIQNDYFKEIGKVPQQTGQLILGTLGVGAGLAGLQGMMRGGVATPNQMMPFPGPQMGTQPAQIGGEAQKLLGGPTPLVQNAAPAAAAVQAAAQVPNVIEQMGLTSRIDNMKSAGNPAEVIAQVIKSQLTPGQKQFVKDNKIDLQQAVQEYLSSPPQQVQAPQPEQAANPVIQPNQGEITPQKQPNPPPEPVAAPVEAQKPKGPVTGQLGMLPSGEIVPIKSVNDKVTDVEINGKDHRRKTSDITPEPQEIANLDINDLVTRIAEKFPESEQSSNLAFVDHLPGVGMLTRYHSGSSGVYLGVPQELMDEIMAGEGVPVTSGETRGGRYQAGVVGSHGSIVDKVKRAKDANGKLLYPWVPAEKIYHHPVQTAVGKSLGEKIGPKTPRKAKEKPAGKKGAAKPTVSSKKTRTRKKEKASVG